MTADQMKIIYYLKGQSEFNKFNKFSFPLTIMKKISTNQTSIKACGSYFCQL